MGVTPAPTATATESPRAQVEPLPPEGPNLFPGTYSSNFDPPLTLTIAHEVDLDCAPGYRCRGDVDANMPDWLDFEFGNDHGSELMFFGFDQLDDPHAPGRLIDPPTDFVAWISSFEGVSIVGPTRDIVVGGLPAVQLDVRTDDRGAVMGPADAGEFTELGIGPNVRARITALRVGDRQVWIQATLGPENKVGNYMAAVDGLQTVIDSITWATPAPAGQIVFEDVGDNYVGTQIWIENADGSSARKLVSDSSTDGSVSLSPDGKTAVFYSTPDPKGPAGRITFVDVATGELTELDTGKPAGCDEGPEGDAFAPDGTRIAFERFCFAAGGDFVGGGTYTIGVDGSEVKQVTSFAPADRHEDHRASWSPDGARLVFARVDTSASPEKSAIFTIKTDGTDLSQVTPWELDANDPDWSPDGRLIAFNSPAESGGDQNIYVIAPDGGGLRQLTSGMTTWPDGGQATYHPSWSCDGSQILFAHAPASDGFADLYVINVDGSGLHGLGQTALHENHATWGGCGQ